MSDPASAEDYNRKFAAGQRFFGFGLETGVGTPCPACAEPDFMVCRVVDMEATLRAGAVCRACGRGFRTVFPEGLPPGVVRFEVVQTVGPDVPSYMPPIRRVLAT